MLAIQKIGMVQAPIKARSARCNFEPMKIFKPQIKEKVLYVKCGAAGSPPPGGSGDGNKNLNNLSEEMISKILEQCKHNVFIKKFPMQNRYSKVFPKILN